MCIRDSLKHGVRQWVVIHFSKACYAASVDETGFWQPSVKVPTADIAGASGAGDALAAGVLHGWHEHLPMRDCLRLGVCAAACSLLHPTCSEGVRPAGECLEFGHRHGFHRIPV